MSACECCGNATGDDGRAIEQAPKIEGETFWERNEHVCFLCGGEFPAESE